MIKRFIRVVPLFVLTLVLGITQSVGASSTALYSDDVLTITISLDTADFPNMNTSNLLLKLDSSIGNENDFLFYGNIDNELETNVVYMEAYVDSASNHYTIMNSNNDVIYTYKIIDLYNDLGLSTKTPIYFRIEFLESDTYKIGEGNYTGTDWGTWTTPLYYEFDVSEPPSIVANLFSNLNDIVTGFIALMVTLFADTGVIAIFYSSADGLTIIGLLLLIGVGYGMVRWAFGFVKKLLAFRG